MHEESCTADDMEGPSNVSAPSFGLEGSLRADDSLSAALMPAVSETPDQGRIMIPLCGPAANQHAAFAKKV